MKEVNVAFLPVEERVFSLENKASYSDYFSSASPEMKEKKLEQIAEQLVRDGCKAHTGVIAAADVMFRSPIPTASLLTAT